MSSYGTSSLFDAVGQRKYLNAKERLSFIRAAGEFSDHIEALCLLLCFTGCRLSEALAVQRRHVLAQQGCVVLQTLKKRRSDVFRMMPIPTILQRKLLDLSSDVDGDVIFPWHRTTAWEKVRLVMNKAEISGPQACPRGARHGFGVAAITAGVPLTLIQRWLAHSRLETTSIYLEITGPEERLYASGLWQCVEVKE